MTRSLPAPLTVGPRAARALVFELARRTDPTVGLLIGVTPESDLLTAAVETMLPTDRLLVSTADPVGVTARLAELGSWVTDRVQVVSDPGAAGPADVVVLAEPLLGTAEETRAVLGDLGKQVAPGGTVAAATVALPGFAPGAAAELERQSALYGVGTDLVLRNLPPLRVHRLRWSPAEPGTAAGLVPMDRPASVPLIGGMHLDSNGVAAAGLSLGMAGLLKLTRPRSRWWLLPAAAALPLAAFFRDPHRDVPDDGSLVVAASDGKVLSVERVVERRFGDGEEIAYLRIAVFLSVLDVHVNRAPVAGEVVDYFVEDGGYAPAMAPDAEHNVSAYTVLATSHGQVVVAQRTGLLARRIVHRTPVGSQVARGERFGLIRFGSRTDVYLPVDAAEPLVAVTDRVIGGVTPIARWR